MIQIYNTMSRKKEPFVPLEEGKAKIYVCGLTVYNFFHIGNARMFCVFDVLRRYLEYRGYEVTYVQNFTDIDDKLIAKAAEENSTVPEIAERYIRECLVDTRGLNILEATVNPRATENIDGIIDIIERLIEKGFAYEMNGDVYFRTRKDAEYGKLSHMNLDDLESGSRVDVSEQKEDPLDFTLWKAAKPGEPFWRSPWGEGRPGWHIECTAMIFRYLGESIDIHCGGQDLIFPHHENEIAQAECCTGKPYVRYWMHNGYINVDNRKMSKSLGNFFTVRDVAEQFGYEPIRFMMLQSHYRSPFNYSTEGLEQCRAALNRLYTCRDNIDFALGNALPETDAPEDELFRALERRREQFISVMDDDLNTADGIAVLFELVKDINTAMSSPRSTEYLTAAAAMFDELSGVLGLVYNRNSDTLEHEVEALIEQRQQARKDRNFAAADAIRDQLKQMGILLEDTPQGVKWTKVR